MGEDGLIPPPGGIENVRVLQPEIGHNRDVIRVPMGEDGLLVPPQAG